MNAVGKSVALGRWRRAWTAAWPPLLAFAGAVALIVAMTWPWCLHWSGEFLDHWDPPFHAWKLEYMARRILAGDVFCSSGNTNMLYPQSGSLYFEALQWPPALLAAGLFAWTALPPEAVYHVALWLFWALSAPCMYFLLRELSCGRAAAVAGALVFCITPHRMSYCVEFQMEMVFAMPLVYAFFLRFFRRGRVWDAVALSASWWLLAVSELYEAVFVLMSLPVLAVAMLAARPRRLLDWRLWAGGAAGGATGVLLLPAMLWPYLTQQGEGAVVRSMREVMYHVVQPFSYLAPWGRFRLWTLDARIDELSLYPTLAVLAGAAGCAALWLWRDGARARARRSAGEEGRLARAVRWIPAAVHAAVPALVVLLVAMLALPFAWPGIWTNPYMRAADKVLHWWMWGLLWLALVPSRGEGNRAAFLRGFAVVASVAWLFSFGPRIVVGTDPAHPLAKLQNILYESCHADWLPFLGNFRVVSRFGVLVVFFLVCAATCFLDAATRRFRAGGRWARAALAGLFAGACALESIPPEEWVSACRPVDDMRAYPVVRRLLREGPPCTLAAIPVWSRELEGMRMFSLLKGDIPYVYAWGGYFPEFAMEIKGAFCNNLRDLWHADLASIYPDVLVLADREERTRVAPHHAPYAEGEAFVREDGELDVDLEKWLDPVAVAVDRDERFTLCALRSLPATPRAEKRFRTDVGRLNPFLEADLEFGTGDENAVALFLNGHSLGRFVPDADGVVRIRADLSEVPSATWSKSRPNLLEFVSGDGDAEGAAFRMARFSLRGSDGLYHDPCTGRAFDPANPPEACGTAAALYSAWGEG